MVTFLFARLYFYYSVKSRSYEIANFPVINTAHNIVRKGFTKKKVSLKIPLQPLFVTDVSVTFCIDTSLFCLYKQIFIYEGTPYVLFSTALEQPTCKEVLVLNLGDSLATFYAYL